MDPSAQSGAARTSACQYRGAGLRRPMVVRVLAFGMDFRDACRRWWGAGASKALDNQIACLVQRQTRSLALLEARASVSSLE
jgi:hypothetical protein